MFTPSRLRLARMRRGLSKAALSSLCGLHTRSLSGYESGSTVPRDEAVLALSRALRFPPEFFEDEEVDLPQPDGVFFRAATRMTASQRDSALGAGGVALLFIRWIESRFQLPSVTVPDLGDLEPEPAADAVRAEWGLGERPISNMIHLLELHGVRVFSLVGEAMEVDAFSHWQGETPFVFLNDSKSGERVRFDAAHELGHLVLHRCRPTRGRNLEWEADRFASNFLMPASSVWSVGQIPPDLGFLIRLKAQWNVSVAALVFRLHALRMLSDWEYRSLCIEIATRGYRVEEPNPIGHETSQILRKILSALRAEGVTLQDAASAIRVPVEDLKALLFGLVPVRLDPRP